MKGQLVGSHGQDLSNRYFHIQPETPFTERFFGRLLYQLDPRYILFSLPDPPAWRVHLGGQILPITTVDGGIYSIGTDGGLIDASASIDPALAASIADPAFRWFHAVEASPYVGDTTLPPALALTSDGGALAAFSVELEGRFVLETSGGSVDTLGRRLLARAAVAAAPPARREYVAVYSRAAGGLFVLGGVDATGQPLDDVWHMDFRGAGWKKVELPAGILGRVLAATFSWKDGRLWIVDEVTSPPHRVRRLIRIEKETGAYEIVASGFRSSKDPKYDGVHLLVDEDGHTLLAVSSARARKHVLATVAASTRGYDVAMSHRRARDLRFSPHADLVGYRFDFGEPKGAPLRDADDDGEIVDDDPELREVPGVRLTTLPLFPAARARLEKLLR